MVILPTVRFFFAELNSSKSYSLVAVNFELMQEHKKSNEVRQNSFTENTPVKFSDVNLP